LKNKKAGIFNKNKFVKEKFYYVLLFQSQYLEQSVKTLRPKNLSCIFELSQFNAKIIVIDFKRKKYAAKLHQ
jgi:hypothetical protein